MYYIYKTIGTEWSYLRDEELCGAADTLDNAKLIVSALESIDPTGGHREIRTESNEVVDIHKKFYILRLVKNEWGFVYSRDKVGIADSLENAKELLKEISNGSSTSKYWEIRDENGNVIEP